MSHVTEERDAPSESAGDGGQVHYQETLSRSAADAISVTSGFAGLVGTALLGGAILIPLEIDQRVGMAAFALLVLGVGGYPLYGARATEVDVRVLDRGVEVSREGSPLGGNETVKVPFEQIRQVQYSDPVESDSHIYVKPNDAGAESFMVHNLPLDRNVPNHQAGNQYKPGDVYEHGVRIGLYEAKSVYVGSERPVELAHAIASRAPDVERAELLPL